MKFVYIYIYIYLRLHTYIICMSMLACVCTYIYIYIYTHTHIYIYIYIYIYQSVSMNLSTYTKTYLCVFCPYILFQHRSKILALHQIPAIPMPRTQLNQTQMLAFFFFFFVVSNLKRFSRTDRFTNVSRNTWHKSTVCANKWLILAVRPPTTHH